MTTTIPFSDLELSAIGIGLRAGEPARILTGKRFPVWRRLARRLLGHRVPTPLADPRLEMLRALAAAYCTGNRQRIDRVAADFVEAGWSLPDVDHVHRCYCRLRNHVAGDRYRDSVCLNAPGVPNEA